MPELLQGKHVPDTYTYAKKHGNLAHVDRRRLSSIDETNSTDNMTGNTTGVDAQIVWDAGNETRKRERERERERESEDVLQACTHSSLSKWKAFIYVSSNITSHLGYVVLLFLT